MNQEEETIEGWKIRLDGKAKFCKVEKEGKTLWIIANDPFSKEAVDIFNSHILEEITDPREWLFLINGRNIEVYECCAFNKIAQEKHIPIEDPFFGSLETTTIELYLSLAKWDVPKDILLGTLGATLITTKVCSNLEEAGNVLGISGDTLHEYIVSALRQKYYDFKKYQEQYSKAKSELIEFARALSAQVVNCRLRAYPKQTNIFINADNTLVGIFHADFLVPEEWELDDNIILPLTMSH